MCKLLLIFLLAISGCGALQSPDKFEYSCGPHAVASMRRHFEAQTVSSKDVIRNFAPDPLGEIARLTLSRNITLPSELKGMAAPYQLIETDREVYPSIILCHRNFYFHWHFAKNKNYGPWKSYKIVKYYWVVPKKYGTELQD